MKNDATHPDIPSDDALPPALLEALRSLPSEQGGPSAATDAAIMAEARTTLASIRQRRPRQRFWPALAAAACVFLTISLFTRPRDTPSRPASVPAEDKYALILREVSAVFPEQLQAIIAEGGELRISLADHTLSNKKQAVVVELRVADKCTTVITYVGQTVEVGEHRVTVRTDAKGAIVVDARNSRETGEQPEHPAPHLHIKTRRI